MVVPCIDGVKAKNQSAGADIACNSKVGSSAAGSDGLLLKLINISGLTKTVSIKLIPKDSSGVENESQSKTVSATISPDPNPIAAFNSSLSTTEPGKPVTLSWDIPEASGANISMECAGGIKATSPSYTGDIPCGKQIFSTALSKTGTLVLNFTNSSLETTPVTVTLFPQIGAGVYNGINTGTLKMNVASDYVPDPIVNFFKTSAPVTAIFSGENFPISWSTEYTKGVNLKISCAEGITATSSKNPEIALPCGDFAFSELLATSSSLKLSFKNQSENKQALILSLIPAFKNKEGYDATKTKTLSVEVRPKSDVPIVPPPPTPLETSPAGAAGLPSTTVEGPLTGQAPTKPKTIPQPTPAPASTKKTIPERAKDIPSTLERLFNAPQEKDRAKNALESKEKRNKISEMLIDAKKLDAVETIFLNPLDETYDISGYLMGKLFYIIPIKVKINLVVGASSGEVKKTKRPWWSFLVRF